ncbi:meiotic 217 [Haematobia irritans]|uniref:meiotic 217 n=1 Tax=Haematobia irritans TaxID=7368 RepID=UPI003F506BEB
MAQTASTSSTISNSTSAPSGGPNRANISNSYLTQSFRDQRQIENYVRSNKLLKVIEEATHKFLTSYKESKRPEDALDAIIVKLSFIYGDFFGHPLELLQFCIEEPVEFYNAVKYCAFGIIRDILKHQCPAVGSGGSVTDSSLKFIDIDQVHVQVRFLDFPLQPELCFEPYLNSYRTGISLVIGILSAITETDKIIIQSVWYCSKGCTSNKVKSIALEAPLCSNCNQPMSEYSKLRHTQNYCLIRILPAASVETPRKLNQIYRSITIRVYDHVHDCPLLLGNRYVVTGYYNYSQQSQEFQAWNITTI